MAGLSHFNSAKAAVSIYEPVFQNQFEVFLQPPPSVFNPLGNAGRTLAVENIKTISGLLVDKNPGTVEQRYKFARRRYAAGAVTDSGVELTIDFEANLDDNNSNYVFKTLRQWSDLIYNPLTGAMGIKSTYANGTYMLINIFNKEGDVFRKMIFHNVFPKAAITPMALDYKEGKDIYSIQMVLRADWFEDVFN